MVCILASEERRLGFPANGSGLDSRLSPIVASVARDVALVVGLWSVLAQVQAVLLERQISALRSVLFISQIHILFLDRTSAVFTQSSSHASGTAPFLLILRSIMEESGVQELPYACVILLSGPG